MTIKKRLFISNILMVVIPFVVSGVTALVCLLVLLNAFFYDAAYEVTDVKDLYATRIAVVELTEELLEGSLPEKSIAGLKNALDKSGMVLWVREADQEIYRLGDGAADAEDGLMSAIIALGGEGTVSNLSSELYARKLTEVKSGEYTLFLYNQKNYEYMSAENVENRIFLVIFSALSGFVAVIFLANRFLTRFVFRKIEQPLEILSGGVRQIRDGNLEYRISYDIEDEFKPVCEDFNEMAARLKASVEKEQKNDRNRKELLSGISHDLRSPLTSIRAFVEGLLDGVASTSEMRNEYLQIIKTKTDDINNMVAKLFLFSKMDMGEYPYFAEKLDIGKEISDFVAASQDDYKARGLLIELGSIPTGSHVYADPIQLRSVLANILDNSAKYKEKDSAKAAVHCEVKEEVIRIVLEDDGPGVSVDALPKLFDAFYRSDPSRNNPQKGSGLGLAIAAKAAERMQGRIYAENRKEGGLRTIFEIPTMKGETKNEEDFNYRR